jgi:predicted RNase H-like HicB family nuclease
MTTLQYLLRIDRDHGSDWGGSVPGMPGFMATGKTLDGAMHRISSAVAVYIRGLREDGVKPPRPRRRTFTARAVRNGVDFFALVEVAA